MISSLPFLSFKLGKKRSCNLSWIQLENCVLEMFKSSSPVAFKLQCSYIRLESLLKTLSPPPPSGIFDLTYRLSPKYL